MEPLSTLLAIIVVVTGAYALILGTEIMQAKNEILAELRKLNAQGEKK